MPRTVGRYLVLHRLGCGGMGVVLAAYDPELDRRVALKIVRTEARDTGDGIGPDAVTARVRLAREAQTLARLNHPNVVTVYDVGTHAFDPASDPHGVFLAMELIDGTNLAQWLVEECPSWPEIRRVFIDAARGLAAAHEVGVVHRDFKASNVLLAREDRGPISRVCVTDFGLARAETTVELSHRLGAARNLGATMSPDGASSTEGELEVELTLEGKVVGTPAYMAPEQHLGRTPDHRADQYAFCITLFEALWGHRPFDGANHQELSAQKNRGPRGLGSAPRVKVPRSIRRCIFRGLHPDPNRRHRNMHELIAELERDTRRRPVTVAIAAGMATGVLGVVVHQSAGTAADPCASDRDEIEAIWSTDARRALAQRFAEVAPRTGTEAFSITAGHIDRYSEDWRRQFDEACRATWKRGEQSQTRLRSRLACLQRHVHGLDAVVALLSEPDPGLVQRAPEIVLSLPAPDDCSDPRRLPPADELPTDAGLEARSDEVRRLLTRARTRQAAGRYEEARSELRALHQTLGPWATPGLQAEVALALGSAQDDMGEHRDAVTTFMEAAEFARRSSDTRLEALAWMGLARTYGQRLVDLERGRFYLDLASACLETLGRDDRYTATLALTHGRIAFAAGEDDEAYAALSKAVALREGLYGSEDYRVADVRSLLAGAQMRRYELPEARASLLQALHTYERVFGPRHTRVANVHGNLGFVLASMGESEEAIHHVRIGRAIFIDTFGPDHRSIAKADDTLGDLLRRTGRLEEAITRFESSIQTYERLDGEGGPEIVAPLMGLADAELARGNPGRALALLDRARRIGRDLSLPPVQWGDIHLSLAEAHVALGHAEAAAEALAATRAPYDQLDRRDDRFERIGALQETLRGSP